MSNKVMKHDVNNEPKQLEDKDLDQVSGGEELTMCYTEIKWTYGSKSRSATTKDKAVSSSIVVMD